jgi:hypothetical protein
MAALLMEASRLKEPAVKVSRQDYEQWARGFVFDGLRDLRYGQSFCNRFGITDNILYYARTFDEADRYIQKTYVK